MTISTPEIKAEIDSKHRIIINVNYNSMIPSYQFAMYTLSFGVHQHFRHKCMTSTLYMYTVFKVATIIDISCF
jgi:hypothetical protein